MGTEGVGGEKSLERPWVGPQAILLWGGMKEGCWAVSSLSKHGLVPPPCAASFVGALNRVTLAHLSLWGGPDPSQGEG